MASLDRQILMGPDWVARAASSAVTDPKQRWMLRQPRHVRRSYAREVLGRLGEDRLAEAWMLMQPDAVRLSYVDEVLNRSPAAPTAPSSARGRSRGASRSRRGS
jgi:hypothetical protein